MRLFEFEEFKSPDEVYRFINANCKPYISENPRYSDDYLFRGLKRKYDSAVVIPGNKNRQPVDVPNKISLMLDKALIDAGFSAVRSNSIFATGELNEADEYSANGDIYVIFPIGNFTYTYSKEVTDLYLALPKLFKSHALEIDWYEPIKNVFEMLPNNVVDHPKQVKIYDELRNKTMSLDELFNRLSKNPDSLKRKFLNALASQSIIKQVFNNFDVPLKDSGLIDFIRENYSNTNLIDAIHSDVEVMINCDSYLAVPNDQINSVFEG